jgi:hypothetical protein
MSGQRAATPGPALKIVVIAGEDAVNVIQQRTATAPVIEVRDRNDQPVAGAVVNFAIRGGRATFQGARVLSVTTDAAGRAVAAGFTPTASGAVQISASAAFQGQTAAAITFTQPNVLTAAQAAAAVSGAGASAGGGTATAGAGAAGGGGSAGGGLSITTIGIVGGAAAGGTLIATNLLGPGGTVFRTSYAGNIVMVPGSCSFVEPVFGTLTITLEDPAAVRGTVEVNERHTITTTTCGNQGTSADDSASGVLAGTPDNLTFSLQSTNSLSNGSRIKPWSFVGRISGAEITGVLTTGDINQNNVTGTRIVGTTDIALTLRQE